MQISAYIHSLPKAGSTPEEYEDAFCSSDEVETNDESVCFAVADGATETSYSKIWAKLLVDAYCAGHLDESDLIDSIRDIQANWNETVSNRSLPWYAEEKIRKGAFSSLLGLKIKQDFASEDTETAYWEAIAIGDSCLFQIRDGAFLKAFPLEKSEDFNNRPALVSTDPLSNTNLTEHLKIIDGDCRAGDLFLLATDAFACWFLKQVEEDKRPWQIERRSPDSFEKWIEVLRKESAIRNDDVTVIRIELLSNRSLE